MVKRIVFFLLLPVCLFSQTVIGQAGDTYIQFASPTSNFGTATDLRIRNTATDTLRVLLKFDVTGLTGTVTACSLRCYVTLGGASSAGDAWTVTDDSWTETGVTWNTKPARVTNLGAFPAATVSTWIAKDVTSYVTGNDTYSFMVLANSTQNTRFEADEAAGTNDARLHIYTAAGVARRKVIFGDVSKPIDILSELKTVLNSDREQYFSDKRIFGVSEDFAFSK